MSHDGKLIWCACWLRTLIAGPLWQLAAAGHCFSPSLTPHWLAMTW
jgi:hypothetical protein